MNYNQRVSTSDTIKVSQESETANKNTKEDSRRVGKKLSAIALTLTTVFAANVATGGIELNAKTPQSQNEIDDEKINDTSTGYQNRAGLDIEQASKIKSVDYERKDDITETWEQNSERVERIFSDIHTEAVARKYHIHAEDYFILRPETADKLAESTWAYETDLLPIYTPAIYKYEEQIKEAAQEFYVPANYIAQIMQIESSGYEKSHSGADAYGLMQIVPRYHTERFVKMGYLPKDASYSDYKRALSGQNSKISLSEYEHAFYNPEASIMVGTQFLSELIASARRHYSDLPKHHPKIYARAAMGYNGGGKQIRNPENKIPHESANYGVSVERMIIDAAIASELRSRGLTDAEIATAMTPSEELKPLIFAIRSLNVHRTTNKNARGVTYSDIVAFIQGINSPNVKMAYEIYNNGEGHLRSFKEPNKVYVGKDFDKVFSPGVMLDLQTKGLGLYFNAGNHTLLAPWESETAR